MNPAGLVDPFPINRPLETWEFDFRRPQNTRTRSRPLCQGMVIRMNSTYLECVDKFYSWKGVATTLALSAIVPFGGGSLYMFLDEILKWSTHSAQKQLEAGLFLVFLVIVSFIMLRLFVPLFLKESFGLTHYPIRFNRKTRMVHVFRLDGTVMTEAWDKLLFVPAMVGNNEWEIHGHRLSEDRKTVLDTFSLPYISAMDDESESPLVYSFWEFVRRYMEEPEELPALADQVLYPMEIPNRRESWWGGFTRLLENDGQFWVIGLIALPFTIPVSFGRWFAIHTSRLPKWPAKIEAECAVDPDDPYIRDAKHLREQIDRALAVPQPDLQTLAGMEQHFLSSLSPEMSEAEKQAQLAKHRPGFEAKLAKLARKA